MSVQSPEEEGCELRAGCPNLNVPNIILSTALVVKGILSEQKTFYKLTHELAGGDIPVVSVVVGITVPGVPTDKNTVSLDLVFGGVGTGHRCSHR